MLFPEVFESTSKLQYVGQGIGNINDGQISRLVNVDNWDSRKPQNGEVWISRDECAELIVRN